MATWLHAESLHQSIGEGHGKVTAMMWNFTAFDGDIGFDEEIHNLIAMEEAIGDIPPWAVDVAVQIDALPHCGQVNFPQPLFALFRGIGRQCPDPDFLFCFEASSATKARVKRLVEVMEAWVDEYTQDAALSEWPDVQEFIRRTYTSLGESTELKQLLVGRVALYLRFSIEELVTNEAGVLTISWCQTPELNRLDVLSEKGPGARLGEVAEREGYDVDRFFDEMEHPWLCHHRLFDQIDVTLQRIGREKSHYDPEQACQDAQGFAHRMGHIYDICIDALTDWLNGEEPNTSLRERPEAATILTKTYDVLGERNPVKEWLASAFRKKMTLFRAQDLEETLAV